MQRPVADPPAGALVGIAHQGVAQFRGVPYAAPPLGALRFAPPAPHPGWPGQRDASEHGPIAPQGRSRLSAAMGDFTRPQSEDCLTLTITTPAADGAARPVLVWLHGGAWTSGAGSLDWYDAARLARQGDIVVVGVNYRLGALGYLCHPGISPANLGTQDQVAALEWVVRNIASFGGDPGCITLGGQSAGATSSGQLLTNPRVRGMLRRVVLQSAAYGRPAVTEAEAAEMARQFLAELGIDPAASDAAAQLRALPVAGILAAQGAVARARARFGDTNPPFAPCHPAPLAQDGVIAGIAAASAGLDVLVGATREECHAFFAADPAMAELAPDELAATFARLSGSAETLAAYRQQRPGGSPMALLADLASESIFRGPARRLMAAMAQAGARVFAYQFNWAAPASVFGACHCIELPFVFGTLDAWQDAPMLHHAAPEELAALSDAMRGAWIGFIRTGVPGPDATPPWTAFTPARPAVMHFDRMLALLADTRP